MQPVDCPFCGHANPEGAKFCNECGSPLHLAPCKECDAVNHVNDTVCYRCGALLTGGAAPSTEAAPDDRPFDRLAQQADWVEEELHRFTEEPSALAQESIGIDARQAETDRGDDVIEHDLGAAAPVRDSLAPADQSPPGRKPEARAPATRTLDRSYGAEPRGLGVGSGGAGTRRETWFVTDFADEPRSRWRGFAGGTLGVALAAAIAAGGYWYFTEQFSPGPAVDQERPIADRAPTGSGMSLEKDAGASTSGPLLVSGSAPAIEKRSDAIQKPAPAPTAPSAAPESTRAIMAPLESGTESVAPAPGSVPVAASEPRCPPAVEAIALCEWFTHEDRK